MGYQIIRQPGTEPPLFGIFCSGTDTIIVWDATADEVEQWFVELAVKRARRDVRQVLEHVTAGSPRRAYAQFAMTWEQALEKDRQNDGEVWEHFQRDGSET